MLPFSPLFYVQVPLHIPITCYNNSLKGFYISPWNEKNMIDVAILSSILCPSPFAHSNDLLQPLSVLSKMLSCCKRSTSTWVLIKASDKQDVFKTNNHCHVNATLNSDPLVIMKSFGNVLYKKKGKDTYKKRMKTHIMYID